ncbi:MAG: hypothetical protein ACJAXW_001649 [Candidatus Azotimanducaceae bacterium]|jgi:hypothetical protein
MQDETREHIVNGSIWLRGLHMLLMAVAYNVVEAMIALIAVFQFFSALLTGSVNEPLLKFAKNGSIYIQEVLEFLTFNSEIRPFPFTSWPDEAHTGEDWLDEAPQNSEAVETTAEVVDEALGDDHNKNKSD